jgi:hypothetical protein
MGMDSQEPGEVVELIRVVGSRFDDLAEHRIRFVRFALPQKGIDECTVGPREARVEKGRLAV